MTLTRIIEAIKARLPLQVQFFMEMLSYWKRLCQYNASTGTDNDINKNLINSLHYVGLGGIPLSCGFLSDKLLKIQKRFNIPKNEVMIAIIGTGYMVDEMKIAVSTRRNINQTNIFH